VNVNRRYFLLLGSAPLMLATVTAGCTDKRAEALVDTTRSPSAAKPVAKTAPPSDSLGRLISALMHTAGTFDEGGSSGGWQFEPGQQLMEAIADFGDSAVVRLVECMGDTTRAEALARGRTVPRGVLCHEALMHTAYYEAYDERPEGANKYKRWDGDIPPTATVSELLKAQVAWLAIVRTKRYRLL
jgi:hypothetical protein